jgi:glutamyl-tRNA reductase
VSVVVVGLEHHRTPLDVLERATVSDQDLPKTLATLRDRSNLLEVVVLSTCLRTEVYAVVERFHEGVADLQGYLAESVGTTVEQLAEKLNVQFDDAVTLHLFEIAAGLRSPVPGEHEVLGQVRTAAERAEEEKASGPVLSGLFEKAVKAGRRVRVETSIGKGTTSLSHLSVELVQERLAQRFGSARIAVVGAGAMARGVTKTLKAKGVTGERVQILNRTTEKAEELAQTVGAAAAGLDSLPGALADVDAVIVTTSARKPVLDRESVLAAMSARVSRRLAPLVIVDLSVPRNVDPAVAALGGVELADVMTLGALAERALATRRGELELAETIVREEVERYREDNRARGAAPQVAMLRSTLEEMRVTEIDKMRKRRNDLSDDQWQKVDEATRAVMAKLLHRPSVALKDAAGTPRGERLLEAIRALFDL